MALSPGDMTRVRVYDDVTGRLKYVFEAKSWEPISETDYHLRDLIIQIFMPRGEITYISADEAQVTLAARPAAASTATRLAQGHVKVAIDRRQRPGAKRIRNWRTAPPSRRSREHPIARGEVDMDRAELIADGEVLVDSVEARVEQVRGLTLQWDQVDNRIDVLRFNHGGTMSLRRGGGMIDFAMPGTTRASSTERK